MKIYEYKNYEEYLDNQIEANVKKLKNMISKIFNYVESEAEMNSTIKHYKNFYSIIK